LPVVRGVAYEVEEDADTGSVDVVSRLHRLGRVPELCNVRTSAEHLDVHLAEDVLVFDLLDLVALLFVDDKERHLHAAEVV
jgi:hypothetical protein